MSVTPSLIPGFKNILKPGDPARKSAAIRQIGQLFAQGAAQFSAAHIALFDDVLTGLLPHSEPAARADLAAQMATLTNAPPALIRHLVNDNSIAVCGPLLAHSSLIEEPTLIDIARMKSQPHLFAISSRATLAAGVTDVIVRRGDRDVVRRVAGNAGAAFSTGGYSALIRRAGDDGALALTVGQRADISDDGFKALLDGSVDLVRRRLLATASVTRRESIGRAADRQSAKTPRRDFVPAQKEILALRRAGSLDEQALLQLIARGEYEITVAALSALSGASIATIDDLMSGERHDPLLVLGRAIGLDWMTVRAVIGLRPGPTRLSPNAYDDAHRHYDRLMRPTAQRVLELWRMRRTSKVAS